MLCLDTNIAIALLRGGRPDVEERLREAFIRHGRLSLSTIVITELVYGVHKSRNPGKSRRALQDLLALPFDILPFTETDADHAGAIRADLSRRGLTIGGFDALIAAQTVARGFTLVTNNGREFSRIKELSLEDWLSPAP